jgi:hypothetical protein
MPQLVENFHTVLESHTAGDPMREEVIWTDLTATDIAASLTELGTPASVYIVDQLLDMDGYRLRKALKSCPMGPSPDRDVQFQNIARLKAEYWDSPNPILSIDSKKREMIGNFYRDGKLYTRQTQLTFDHDYSRFADGVIIPHGIYDLRRNFGYIHLGTSHDTSLFACDCLEDWWERYGKDQYSQARSILLLCDGGGSNSARTYLLKADLQRVVNRLGIEVRVAHYAPYCSKWNPIEHRLFPHLTRACQGVIFRSVALVKQLMEKARTRTGLRVVVDVVDKVYEVGRRVADEVKKTLNFVRDSLLPQLNYRVLPQT